MYFPPKFEFQIHILIESMRKDNLKIKLLAGKKMMSIFHVGFEFELPLVS